MRRAAALAACVACACGRGPGETESAPFRFVAAERETLARPTWCGRPEKPHIAESGGTGLALFDYDGDHDLDLYVVEGWRLAGSEVVERARGALYRNRGDGTFEDVTEKAGLAGDGWGCGAAVGDVEGDGDLDLFVAGFGPDALYENQGDGTFRTVAGGPGIDGWSTGAVFFDADRDGDEDLFVAGYVDCSLDDVLHAKPTLAWKQRLVMKGPFGLEGLADRYFENTGGGRFRDATEEAGLVDVGKYYGFTAVALDLDQDLDLDLYVANDSNPHYFYRNDGHGRFEEIGLWSGAALDKNGAAQAGMGIASGDLDDDGLSELFVTTFADDSATLFKNLGDCLFADETRAFGLREPTFAPLKWGAAFEDFDLDGDLDLFVANGHIYPQADEPPESGTRYRQSNLLLAREGARFVDASASAGPGLALVESSRGLAAGDVDGDGDVDLVVSNVDAPPTLLRNDTARKGAWLSVDAPGALRVTLEHGGRRRVRDAVRGGSYVSVGDARFHFGLGPIERVERVRVLWPDGEETTLDDQPVDRVLSVRRP